MAWIHSYAPRKIGAAEISTEFADVPTNKEVAHRLRQMAGTLSNMKVIAKLQEMADELDPPAPRIHEFAVFGYVNSNGSNPWGIGVAMRALTDCASANGYKYVAWNGKVYKLTGFGGDWHSVPVCDAKDVLEVK